MQETARDWHSVRLVPGKPVTIPANASIKSIDRDGPYHIVVYAVPAATPAADFARAVEEAPYDPSIPLVLDERAFIGDPLATVTASRGYDGMTQPGRLAHTIHGKIPVHPYTPNPHDDV